jgi:aldose 1-epimerase
MLMSFRVSTETVGQRTVFRLHDDASGATASILPSSGFNLFDLRLPVGATVRPILVSTPDFARNPTTGARNGIPVLFPFPNRIRDGRFTFAGRTYSLPLNSKPNAIHGFAVSASWDVIEHKADSSNARIKGRYQISHQSPDMRKHWPTDAILELTYKLADRRLELEVAVANPTAVDLPFGFGIHPYFRLPFETGGDQSKTLVVLPASQYWVLKDFLPTGEREPVTPRLDFRTAQPIRGLKLDDVLTGLSFDHDRCTCRLVDQALNAEFQLSFDRSFRELVVYTPPGGGGVISPEPYTQTTDAINLQERGIDAGLRILKHGAQASMIISMETVG